MQEPSEKNQSKHRISSWLRPSSWTFRGSKQAPILPVDRDSAVASVEETIETPFETIDAVDSSSFASGPKNEGQGTLHHATGDDDRQTREKRHITYRFYRTTVVILCHNWYINGLIAFVPAGIAVHFVKLPLDRISEACVSFVLNGLAIIPLANLLAVGTESLAKQLGNSWGALLNVTMGNLVELIIFCLAIYKDELRIVQASLIGSILANMLFIFGLALLVGGVKYMEQAYNNTVSQMNAILLGLCVATLVIPTAFFFAFKQTEVKQATRQMLHFSRGTSFILLGVYFIYLYFQLRTHKHLYVGTPQHVLDEQALPGPAASWFYSSSDSSSSESDTDSNNSSASEGKRAKLKRVINRARHRRDTTSQGTISSRPDRHDFLTPSTFPELNADLDSPAASAQAESSHGTIPPTTDRVATFNIQMTKLDRKERKRQKKAKKKEKKERKRAAKKLKALRREYDEAEKARNEAESRLRETSHGTILNNIATAVNSAVPIGRFQADDAEPIKRRSSLWDAKTKMPKVRSTGLWQPNKETNLHPPRSTHSPRVYGTRHSGSSNNFVRHSPHSNELSRMSSSTVAYPPYAEPLIESDDEEELSKTSAITLVVISTAMVALCAYGMVDAIDGATKSGGGPFPDIFVGLIVIPIVGNAAEHFTAVKMAQRNKMDLTIGIAVGSSLQIGKLSSLFLSKFLYIWALFMAYLSPPDHKQPSSSLP